MIDAQTVVVRLLIALAFGAAIGVEREWRQKQAGLKTMSLVALGAAAFALMSDTFGPSNHNPGQIAAAVVGGIGFIGAGVIMHRGLTVQGLTTAATLWADASVGVAAGLGQIPLAIGLGTGIVIIQIVGRGIEQQIRRFRRKEAPGRFELRVESDESALHEISEAWAPYGPALRRSVQRSLERVIVRVVMRATKSVDLGALEEKLVAIEGVRRVDVRHLGIEDET
ncbi:MAG TPA: MgtC/SapB family protein [Thermoanaerobaculia bacterium]|nr:MgtC/SapB family protein [Thermoanaerobaculia bacterium]